MESGPDLHADPESKVILDPAAAQICYFGAAIVDPFSGSNSTNSGRTVIVNYVDLGVAEPSLVVVGGT